MPKRCLALLLTLALALQTTGCLQDKGLDQYVYVTGIGFDRGQQLPYKFTCMLQKIDYGSGEQRLSGVEFVTAEGNNLFEAVNTLCASLPLQMSFVRTVLLVAERSLLEDRAFLDQLINTSLPSLLIRYSANLFVSLCSAEQVLRGLDTKLDPGLVKMQENFETYSEDTGLIPMLNLMDISESLTSGAFDLAAPLCGTNSDSPGGMQDSVGEEAYAYLGGNLMTQTDMKTELVGTAIFSDCALVGILNGQNTQLLQIAVGEFDRCRIRFGSVEGMEVSVMIKRHRPTRITLERSETPRAVFEIDVTAYIEQPDHMRGVTAQQAKDWLTAQMTERYDRLFTACRDLKSDVFGLKKTATTWFSSAQALEAFDFQALYAEMEAEFVIRVQLTNAPDKSIFE